MSSDDVVILAGARTPQGRLLGQLASFSAVELGAIALRSAIERAGVDVSDIDAVIFGQVLQAGAGQNPARQTSRAAGIGWEVPAVTVNKVCLSGIHAVVDAARLIRAGEASVVVAGGQESMTNAPHVLPAARKGYKYGEVTMIDTAAFDGLTDAFDGDSMGISTERHNGPLGIDRGEQDTVAAASHQRSAQAQAAGVFDDEITPVTVPTRRGEPTVLTSDEGVRGDSTVESLSALRPAFDKEGTITAGNSSPLSDGACALILARRSWAEERGLSWLAVVGASGSVAGPDNSLHSQPSRAIADALAKAGWTASDLDLIEINEAFAAVSVQSMRDLDVDHEKVNIHGGAISLGHPIGASGARVVLHAALELSRRGSGKAAAALCGGGGQGDALLLSR
ncbi:acetyl-CoA C-acetyltransferase [Mycetocola manganoxydans]|uniref:Probable acetyl-CoA acetyltransferase n=1 Tax=Mycetocola manganoxydans TaxID=699879 RepID=A0A3L7A383_9MICO|nr:acetyl-CoA C-acetyltransferase [Mycetocola manganoxydans]RLP73732.1 acetyl-CoA C-acetyltransferase [Mycetocola manganoxydans]GHD43331.1 acetyl-CoA acetyltransferase [Mycetocola manganoxydans]